MKLTPRDQGLTVNLQRLTIKQHYLAWRVIRRKSDVCIPKKVEEQKKFKLQKHMNPIAQILPSDFAGYSKNFGHQHSRVPSNSVRRSMLVQRLLLLTLSLFFIVGGISLAWLNEQDEVLSYYIAVVSVWFGIAGAVVSLFMFDERIAVPDSGGFWFYSGGAPQLRPVVDKLKLHNNDVGGKAVLLFISEQHAWKFIAGYNCTPNIAANIICSIPVHPGHARQEIVSLRMLDDGVVSAVCTPVALNSGLEILLVSVHEASGQIGVTVSTNSFLAAVEIGRIFDVRTQASNIEPSNPTCCAICDRIQNSNGEWLRWDAWLWTREQVAPSHTVCTDCASWAYSKTSIR